MLRLALAALLAIMCLAGSPMPVLAQQQSARIALIITNQAYTQDGARLTNTHLDGDLIKAALETVGFKVTAVRDTPNEGAMLAAIAAHVARLSAAGPDAVGFFYYSGHGAADRPNGENYLIPTAAPLTHVNQLPLLAVRLERITEALSKTGRMSFVVFDACRNVPLQRDDKSSFKGFAPVREQSGLLVAFATDPGNVAVDQSLYARALSEEIVRPGQEAGAVFRRVRLKVRAGTQRQQSPEYLDKRDHDFQFAAEPQTPPVAVRTSPTPAASARLSEAAEAWTLIRNTTDIAVLEAYIRRFGDTFYGELAKTRLASTSPCSGVEIDVAGSGRRCLKPKDTFEDCFTSGGKRICGPKMVVIPPGRFLMGTPDAEIEALIKEYPKTPADRFRREAPQHEVSIGRAFAVGETHVTRGQFAAFVTATGHKTDGGCLAYDGKEWTRKADKSWRDPGFAQDDNHPAVCINWTDAQAYAAWIKQQTGVQYRLLSEAEAEYVARGVTTPTPGTRYFFGNDPKDLCRHDNGADLTAAGKFNLNTAEAAQCRDEFVYTAPAGRFSANPFGLKDVHGNAWSWTEDCFVRNYRGAPRDGSARTSGDCSSRVLRGGSWINFPQGLRSAYHNWYPPGSRNSDIGFRLARTLIP